MSILRRLFRDRDDRAPYRPLYDAIVAEARAAAWYQAGGVPDTLDGRFDMVAAILAIVLIRLEAAGDSARLPSTLLTEIFIDDMDGQLRQIGIGDFVVGKHLGRMMSALGGRLTAYREALTGEGNLAAAMVRNIWRGETPDAASLAGSEARLRAFHARLAALPAETILAGRLA
jgi:cytochrome b pre-mRNA-processing protein 3